MYTPQARGGTGTRRLSSVICPGFVLADIIRVMTRTKCSNLVIRPRTALMSGCRYTGPRVFSAYVDNSSPAGALASNRSRENRDLAHIAAAVAQAAGKLLTSRPHDREPDFTPKSSPVDMVTEYDLRAERLIRSRLRAARPDDGVLGEEGGEEPGTSGTRWIIDPLDGTANFVHELPAFAVSVAAEVDGVVVAGAVHDPSRAETFAAVLGGGAWCGGRPLRASATSTMDAALVSTGFSSDPALRPRQAEVVARVVRAAGDLRGSGSAALDLCWVAAGRLDAYYESGLRCWDWAAGALIAAEAGAEVHADDRLVTACAPGLAAAFAALVGHG
ncbi:inositol monophosphatase family protein [Saccharomonospora xinjiangensis]|uniref:inositol monophosphatase family protein n=1 Tax=Saccharomonospora xinjiangensis TaxID=75294 RepID=UPI003510A5CF